MKAKVFEVSWPIELEKPLNQWLLENPNIIIERTDYYSNIRNDRFGFNPNEICNQYYEFTCIVFYNENTPK